MLERCCRPLKESAYLEEVCRIITEDCGHRMVWIGFAEDDAEQSIHPVAHAGFVDGYLDVLRVTWADTERGRGPGRYGDSQRAGVHLPAIC